MSMINKMQDSREKNAVDTIDGSQEMCFLCDGAHLLEHSFPKSRLVSFL